MNARDVAAGACACTVGAVLHVAAVAKIIDSGPAQLWATALPFGSQLGHTAVAVVIAIELILGWCLLFGVAQRVAAGVAAVLFVLFGVVLLGWPPSGPGCPCFGSLSIWLARTPPVLTDAALAALALTAWFLSSERPSSSHA